MARIVTDGKAYINLELVDTSPTQELGSGVWADSGRYEYFQASGAVAEGAACILTYADGQAAEMDTTGSGSTPKVVGVAVEALADNEYGWFWRGAGYDTALVVTGVSAGDALTTTATAGVLGSGGDTVIGAISAANSSGSTALTAVRATSLLGTNV
jgi:hypothetical protein